GYEAADRKTSPPPAGALPLDAAYSPITKVTYNVEMSRLGKITDYEKLVLEVWTNGGLSPDDALTRAATYLKEHFTPLAAGRSGVAGFRDEAPEGWLQARARHRPPLGALPKSLGGPLPARAHPDDRGQGEGRAWARRADDHAREARHPPRAAAGPRDGAGH